MKPVFWSKSGESLLTIMENCMGFSISVWLFWNQVQAMVFSTCVSNGWEDLVVSGVALSKIQK